MLLQFHSSLPLLCEQPAKMCHASAAITCSFSIYKLSREQFEKAKTHDELWNAAQLQIVHLGKMHGFMRMYWAKKILEWTPGVTEAIQV